MKIKVARIGVMHITHGEESLKAILGSCVGIGIFWKKRKIYTLSHCLLAESSNAAGELNAKYVSDAVPLMLQAMGNYGRDRFQLEAVVVGGGTMLQAHGNASAEMIGPNNLRAATKHLTDHNVSIKHMEDAGSLASQLIIDGKTGLYKVVLIPKFSGSAVL